jgi:hypothetical protein
MAQPFEHAPFNDTYSMSSRMHVHAKDVHEHMRTGTLGDAQTLINTDNRVCVRTHANVRSTTMRMHT